MICASSDRIPSNEKTGLQNLFHETVRVAKSIENRRRIEIAPQVEFQLESPIAEAALFNFDVNQYFSDPVFYVKQTLCQNLWRWQTFPDDYRPIFETIPVWLGHYPEYTFIGLGVGYDRKGVPNIQTDHPLTQEPDLRLLKPIHFKTSGWMTKVLKWYEDVSTVVDGSLEPIFNATWWRGCLDLAIQLRGYDNFVLDTLERPQFVHDLLRFLVEQRCRWYESYYQHFGLKPTPVDIADDWINVPFLSPSFFADFLIPRYLEIEQFHGGIRSIHSCGNQVPVQRYLLTIRSLETLEVSPWSDLTESLQNIPVEKELKISLHPNDVLTADEMQMHEKLRFIVQSCQGRKFKIMTSGLTPLSEDKERFVRQINLWTRTARNVLSAFHRSR